MSRHIGGILAIAGFALYALTIPGLYRQPRTLSSDEMQVALPRFVQVIMSGGDRYLAANLSGFRALVASTETMSDDNYRIQGIVQSDAAWLNPAHEDNYYVAAAILPWNDQLEAGQFVLRQATNARSFDWQPPFFYAFNVLHFLKNPVEAAKWLRIAGQHSRDEAEQIQLQQMAAAWVSKGEDLELAVRMHRAMAKETKNKAFAAFLEKRALRLENLLAIERAVARYRELFGSAPAGIALLVERGLLPAVPVDPFGLQYTIDSNGKAQVLSAASAVSGSAARSGR